MRRGVARGVGTALAVAALAALSTHAFATSTPFGIVTPDSPTGFNFGGPLGTVFAWIAIHQAHFYQALTAALGDLKRSPSGVWFLLGLSFIYGVFHAAGPGHGKAVITSYLLASGETARRGIALSFAAAFVQAVSAIVIVIVATMILQVSAVAMTHATDWVEIASYALIALVGAWLLWSKTFGGHGHHHHHHHVAVPAGASAHDHRDHDHAHHAHDAHDRHDDHDHAHDHDYGHDHDHDHDHEHDHSHDHDHGHVHVVRARPGNTWAQTFAKAWSALLAVGVRPCSGALIVLIFALSQGLFMAGVAATFVMALGTGLTVAALATLAVSAKSVALKFVGVEEGVAGRLVQGVEIAGAAAVLLLGLLLLGGALSTGLPG